MTFAGRVALVTGGGSGIGAAIARALAKQGATTIVADLDETAAEAVARDVAAGYRLDVTDRVACAALATAIGERFGDIAILVNNAGINRRLAFDDVRTPEAWDDVMAVNATGVFNVTYACQAALKRSRGTVVNIGSIQSFVHFNNSAAYTASKGAVALLTKAMAVEFAPFGVRVNAVAPGFTETPMTAPTRGDDDKMAKILSDVPLARFAQPEEIAAPVKFLASDEASYITGITLVVDGGYLS